MAEAVDTEVLSDWAQALMQYLSWWRQQSNQRQQASLRNPRLLGGLWLCYVLGAICESVLELHLALFALVFPLCVLALLIVLDLFRPLQQPEASIS